MKKIILIGSVACGKTTICQYLNRLKQDYKKTQAIEVCHQTIDTPGEYLDHRGMLRSLMVSAMDVDVVVFVQDASRDIYSFSPGQSGSFPMEVIGVVSKSDIASEKQIAAARQLLQLAGADPIFTVSAVTGEGMRRLQDYLRCESV